ncbi:50S ribosomal protein L32 [bacterium]|nr:50S ribosomal protein L32 [bacterium]
MSFAAVRAPTPGESESRSQACISSGLKGGRASSTGASISSVIVRHPNRALRQAGSGLERAARREEAGRAPPGRRALASFAKHLRRRRARVSHECVSRETQALKPIHLSKCPRCREAIRPHTVCGNCGYYRDENVIDVEAEQGE